MNSRKRVKLIALLLSLCVLATSISAVGFSAYSETEGESTSAPEGSAAEEAPDDSQKKEQAQDALEEQLNQIAKDLENSESKLAELGEKSKDTEEYINALDEKIGYLDAQINLLDSAVLSYQEDIDTLQKDIDVNSLAADELQLQVDETQSVLDKLNDEFRKMYDDYCERACALYISGDFSLWSVLLLSEDISSFLTRYEMVKSISKKDAELMSEIKEQSDVIIAKETELSTRKTALDMTLNNLISQQNKLAEKQSYLTNAQEISANKKAILAADRAESDMLLASLNAKNGMYTEFRNEDKALLEAVEKEIESLINGIKNPDDVTLATTSGRDENVTAPIYQDSDVFSNSDAVLNMTYPVPGNYIISCAFGKYSNGNPHNGTDFPCVTGSKVVAAQKGIVLKVQKLNYSYGHYIMIYHGTDSSGRTIVTLYAHNSKILVSPGESVQKGQLIAKAGSTGNSTGPHCHFEIRIDNKAVNAENYLSK